MTKNKIMKLAFRNMLAFWFRLVIEWFLWNELLDLIFLQIGDSAEDEFSQNSILDINHYPLAMLRLVLKKFGHIR